MQFMIGTEFLTTGLTLGESTVYFGCGSLFAVLIGNVHNNLSSAPLNILVLGVDIM